MSSIGFHHCKSDHFIFIRKTSMGIVILTIYVDDILLMGSGHKGICYGPTQLVIRVQVSGSDPISRVVVCIRVEGSRREC